MEWMAFHIAIGFDTLLVYDHMSTDRTRELVQAAGRRCDIRLIEWPDSIKRGQENAYTDACRRHADEFDWIAFLDCDEFIVPLHDTNIKSFLSRFDVSSAIALNWAMFGSSGHEKDPKSSILSTFVNRAPDAFGPNRHVKSVIRPTLLKTFINPHYAEVEGGYVNAQGFPVKWEQVGLMADEPSLGMCRVNHYFTRSRAHWARRMARGQRTPRTWDDFAKYDRNEMPDGSVLRFLPATTLELQRMWNLLPGMPLT